MTGKKRMRRLALTGALLMLCTNTAAGCRQQEKQEAVESAMDALRKKFGRGVISYGTAEDTISGEKIERD